MFGAVIEQGEERRQFGARNFVLHFRRQAPVSQMLQPLLSYGNERIFQVLELIAIHPAILNLVRHHPGSNNVYQRSGCYNPRSFLR